MIENPLTTPVQCWYAARRWLLTSVFVAAGALAGCSKTAVDAVQPLASPAGPGSAEPHLSRGSDGTVVLSWLEPEDDDAVALRYSVLAGGTWQSAQTVVRGDDWFVNWADFPSVTPITDDLWAAHWLAKRPGGTYAYDVAMALSTDGGQSWGEPITPHTDNTRTEHGFVSLFPWRGGVGALWLDGRHTTAEGHNPHSEGHGGGMTLRSAVITPNEAVPDGQLVDDLVCDCCQTDIAITDAGPVAVYRNRTREEIRDVYVARNVDGQWLPGQAVADDGWEISGCPVNGPTIAAHGGNVAVAWFTAANGSSRVRLARSLDGGASFSSPVDIDIDRPIGRVDVEWLDRGETVVSWLRRGSNGQGELAIQTVTADEVGDTQVVATMSTSRPSGFPQMTRDGDYLIFAWTEPSNDGSIVKTARLATGSLVLTEL